MPAPRILDASALLALINDEPGARQVRENLPGAVVSAVNLAEVVGKLIDVGIAGDDIRALVGTLTLTVIPFDAAMAFEAGSLKANTGKLGLSLGDRACLATARVLKGVAVTADREWRKLRVGVPIESVR